MCSFGGTNTHIIEDTNPEIILTRLNSIGIRRGHFNNGTYTLPKDVFAPAFLAAFRRVIDLQPEAGVPLIVAINSDKSMIDSFKGKNNEDVLVQDLAPQIERAKNVTSLLSALFPDRQTVAIFYDEQTPFELYEALNKNGFDISSLHKVGFGTSPDDKPIIGAQFANWVYACPAPFAGKPVMYTDTRAANEFDTRPNLVEDITEVIGPHGATYIQKGNGGKILFPVPAVLSQYSLATQGVQPALKQ